jgi:acetyl esterase/lipase
MPRHPLPLLVLTLVLSISQAGTCRAVDEGWTALFDGKTLDGWTVNGGKAEYKVEDGSIVGTTVEGSPNTFLCKGDYKDFVLELEVKCDPRLNSGVQVRSHVYGKDDPEPRNRQRVGVVYGPQCEVAHKNTGTAGRFYDEGRRGRWLNEIKPEAKDAFVDDDWNRYRIVVQGNRYRSWVNGVAASDFADGMDERGFIGLQVHGIPKGEGPYQVRWRNVRIRELAPGRKIGKGTALPGEILRITTRSEWEDARAEGEYRGDTLKSEGFIHCSTPEQLPWVAESFYKGRTGLVVLRIDPEKLKSPLKWESPPNLGERFPHIYGQLNLDAVVGIAPLEDLLSEGILVHRDIPYAGTKNERQTLDLHAPAEGKGHPVVFWIHGGGWQSGTKADVKAKPQTFVKKGYLFVSAGYRLLPEATIKEMAGDLAGALHWVHDHAGEYGGDPDRIVVMGHSAGAQLAALLCTDRRYLESEGLSPSILKGCVPVDGDTYDVPMQIATVSERTAGIYRRKFGDEASQKDLSPVTHVARDKGAPPFLILHVKGHPETTKQSQRLAVRLKEAGISATAYPAEGKDHGSINADLGLPDDRPTKVLLRFLDETLKK